MASFAFDARTMTVTRFAPSPSGYLHIGHAHAALFAARAAAAEGGHFLLRIEDIDGPRSRPEFEEAIYEDLAWLGLAWEEPVWRQSERLQAYGAALERLKVMGLLYPCFCTRKEIQAEIARAASAPHGPEGALYPGTCRKLPAAERDEQLAAGKDHCLRLDVTRAADTAGPLTWRDLEAGEIDAAPQLLGDVVLARKDIATSYHLAVTQDDAAQGVSLVTRGKDLFHASHIHRLLQELLGLPVPSWHHHGLIRDGNGERLAKRSDAFSLRALRREGFSPSKVRALAGFPDD